MKLDITEKVEIPEGIEVEISGANVIVKSGDKENKKKFNFEIISAKKEGNEIVLSVKKGTKRERKMINTIRAHLNNMIKGVQENFVYELEIAFVHFPMTVEIDEGKKEIAIKNFLGEKKPRICNIIDGAEVKIDGKIITVESYNKEIAGQMAANLEKETKVKKKDVRKFQDGIYITSKCGKAI